MQALRDFTVATSPDGTEQRWPASCGRVARIRSVWLPAAVTAAALGYAAHAAAWPSSQRWGGGLCRLPGDRREIALTFDDGPGQDTPRFLETLAAVDVKATFFLCGQNVARLPGIARSIAAAGHVIGNHTYSHPPLTFCSPARVRRELAAAQAAIEDATGVTARLFRPPYGVRSPALRLLLPEFGLRPVRWTVIGNDWKWEADAIASRVLRNAGPGAIVCLHDAHPSDPEAGRMQTLRAVRAIIPRLRDRGFRFVPLPAGPRAQSKRA